MSAPDDPRDPVEPDRASTPGGPYFGRLLVVLLLAVAFCGFLTWAVATYFEH